MTDIFSLSSEVHYKDSFLSIFCKIILPYTQLTETSSIKSTIRSCHDILLSTIYWYNHSGAIWYDCRYCTVPWCTLYFICINL